MNAWLIKTQIYYNKQQHTRLAFMCAVNEQLS